VVEGDHLVGRQQGIRPADARIDSKDHLSLDPKSTALCQDCICGGLVVWQTNQSVLPLPVSIKTITRSLAVFRIDLDTDPLAAEALSCHKCCAGAHEWVEHNQPLPDTMQFDAADR